MERRSLLDEVSRSLALILSEVKRQKMLRLIVALVAIDLLIGAIGVAVVWMEIERLNDRIERLLPAQLAEVQHGTIGLRALPDGSFQFELYCEGDGEC